MQWLRKECKDGFDFNLLTVIVNANDIWNKD